MTPECSWYVSAIALEQSRQHSSRGTRLLPGPRSLERAQRAGVFPENEPVPHLIVDIHEVGLLIL